MRKKQKNYVKETVLPFLIEEKKLQVTYRSTKYGFVFACTNKSEKKMLDTLTFATSKVYGNKVLAIRPNDYVFLYNLDTDTLYGMFISCTEGKFDEKFNLYGKEYQFFVKVKPFGEVHSISNAKKCFKELKISWRDILTSYGCEVLYSYIKTGKIIKNINKEKLVEKNLIPPIFSTTLWDYPKQSYGFTQKGNNKYPGVTPAFIIYNLIHRYTKPGDLVCDPMAGSGTTIDVCKEEKRKVIAFDIVPTRPDIIQADARQIPLKDNSVDMIFIDSPYGDNIKYNDHPQNIGNLPATSEEFYNELEKVMIECHRILKDGKILAWLIGDQWAKGVFVPVGFKIYQLLTKYFIPVDIICVVRRNQTSNTPFWHTRALKNNFYLRGFKYLIIVKKSKRSKKLQDIKVEWTQYERK